SLRVAFSPHSFFDIPLEKSPAAQGLGISLTGNKEDSRARMGVYVADIDPRGPAADSDGRLLLGDQILSINGEDVRAGTLPWVNLLRTTLKRTTLMVKVLCKGVDAICVNVFIIGKLPLSANTAWVCSHTHTHSIPNMNP
uniref:PDZ domain-containing protein n=1 Tax=Labrus bergylta TaxID=56723 RepID=A0A3Q3H3V2_9LABR